MSETLPIVTLTGIQIILFWAIVLITLFTGALIVIITLRVFKWLGKKEN